VVQLTISCASCGQSWSVPTPFSIYEQQSVESCPCPHCGAYTLCCREPALVPRRPEYARRPLQTSTSRAALAT